MGITNTILECVGKTPLLRLHKITQNCYADVLAKCELFNPAGSIKDRPALSMIETAEKMGLIEQDTVIIESTSGNTGIALAFICAVKGYKLIITMPDSMSLERRTLLKAYGAQVELTPGHLQMDGAIKRADALAKQYPKSFVTRQFENPANPSSHENSTAKEIWEDTEGKIDILVAAVGTGGSISGTARVLKKKNPQIKIFAVEPEGSPVLSGGKPGPHMIQGIGAGFIPKNLDSGVIDEVVRVSNEAALKTTRLLANKEGVLCGISAGANVWAAIQVAEKKENKGKRIVTFLCDVGERYLSTPLFR